MADDARRLSLAMQSYLSPASARNSLPPVVDYLKMYSRGAQPYPRQKTLLKIIFLDDEHFTDYDRMVIDEWMRSTREGGDVNIPLDLYDRIAWCKENGYWHFREVINCTGRRGGKGYIGGCIGDYMTANLVSLGDPQRFYGLAPGKDIYIEILATQYSQAQSMLFNDVKNAILADDFLSPYVYTTSSERMLVQTVHDKERQEEMERGAKGKNYSAPASIILKPFAAVSSSVRGQTAILQMFDEFAHGLDTGSGQSSSEIYSAATPALAQFDKDGMIYIPSSPYSEVGKFFERYSAAFEIKDGHATDPSMFAIRAPSWEMYKDWQYDPTKKRALILSPDKSVEMAAEEARNPEKFAVEFRAHFAKTENAYLKASVVDELFVPYPSAANNHNIMRDYGEITTIYRAHADAGRSQDLFAFAIGHKEKAEDGFYHAFIDCYKVWQPSDFPMDENGVHRVDYTVVLDWLRNEFRRFYVGKMTFDQWNSALFIDQLKNDVLGGKTFNKMMAVSCDNHTSGENFKRYEHFKTACYQGWVHIPHYVQDIVGLGNVCLPQEELKLLVVKNGNKVDHQDVGNWCFDDRTEILTDSGWRLFKDLDGSEMVGTYREDMAFEWQKPIAYQSIPYSGDMYHCVGQGVDFCVTPNHRMEYLPLTHYEGKPYRIDTIEKIFSERNGFLVPAFPVYSTDDFGYMSFGEYMEFGIGEKQSGSWSDEDTDFLKRWFYDVDTVTLAKHLGRSYGAVAQFARKLGLSKRRKHSHSVLVNPVKTSTFARLLGFWLADGTKGTVGDGYVFSISQSKRSGVEYLERWFNGTGWNYSCSVKSQPAWAYGNLPIYTFSISSNGLNDWVVENCFDDDGDYRIPRCAFSEWGNDEREALLEGLLIGDGTYSENRKRFIRIGTPSEKFAGDIQELLLSLGYSSGVAVRELRSGSLFYDVSIGVRGYKEHNGVHRRNLSVEHYDGTVYCVTVPNDRVITRRNGSILMSPNCHNDVSDCLSTVVSDLLGEQIDMMGGEVAQIVGGAQGGYNILSDGFISGGSNDATNAALSHGDAMMRELGYL